jgi:hypothetical protein
MFQMSGFQILDFFFGSCFLVLKIFFVTSFLFSWRHPLRRNPFICGACGNEAENASSFFTASPLG